MALLPLFLVVVCCFLMQMPLDEIKYYLPTKRKGGVGWVQEGKEGKIGTTNNRITKKSLKNFFKGQVCFALRLLVTAITLVAVTKGQ